MAECRHVVNSIFTQIHTTRHRCGALTRAFRCRLRFASRKPEETRTKTGKRLSRECEFLARAGRAFLFLLSLIFLSASLSYPLTRDFQRVAKWLRGERSDVRDTNWRHRDRGSRNNRLENPRAHATARRLSLASPKCITILAARGANDII